jgi:hypothetical protein
MKESGLKEGKDWFELVLNIHTTPPPPMSLHFIYLFIFKSLAKKKIVFLGRTYTGRAFALSYAPSLSYA